MAHNIYFDGKVQSLGLNSEKGRATVGLSHKVGTFSTEASDSCRLARVKPFASSTPSFGSRGFSVATNFESNWDPRRISQETTNIGKHETNIINNS